MKQKPAGRQSSSEQIIKDIKRKTRKQYSAEEKSRVVLDGIVRRRQHRRAVRTLPICRTPAGLGAKRVRTVMAVSR